MSEVHITKHARRRFKQRAKLPARATDRMAALAYEHGLHEDDPSLTPPLRAKMRRARLKDQSTGKPFVYRLYRGLLYIFTDLGALVTVLQDFDDPDQRGTDRKDEVKHWKGGAWVPLRQNRRPRDNEADDE